MINDINKFIDSANKVLCGEPTIPEAHPMTWGDDSEKEPFTYKFTRAVFTVAYTAFHIPFGFVIGIAIGMYYALVDSIQDCLR